MPGQAGPSAPQRQIATERAMLEGALDTLGNDLVLRRDEARHASYIFLLDEWGEVHPLPHTLYVALVRDEATAPDFAGKTLRLAEWYVRIEGEEPESVVNETYCLIAFDAKGRVDWSKTPSFHPHRPDSPAAPKQAALPTAAERERIRAQLFPAGAKCSGQ